MELGFGFGLGGAENQCIAIRAPDREILHASRLGTGIGEGAGLPVQQMEDTLRVRPVDVLRKPGAIRREPRRGVTARCRDQRSDPRKSS